MVEFVRDVVIVVAILVALMAVAHNPTADADGSRSVDQRSARVINIPGPSSAEPIVTPAPIPQANAH